MLNQKIVLTIPSTNGNQEPDLDTHRRMLHLAQDRLGTMFGGFTTIPAVGGWVSDEQGVIIEDVQLVNVFCDESALNKYLQDVFALAAEVAFYMGQECVSLEVNGCLHFVDPVEPKTKAA